MMYTKLTSVDLAPRTFTLLEESIENLIRNFIARHCEKIVHHGIDLYLHDEGILFYDDSCDSENEIHKPDMWHNRNMEAAIDYATFRQTKYDWSIPEYTVMDTSCTTLRALVYKPKQVTLTDLVAQVQDLQNIIDNLKQKEN